MPKKRKLRNDSELFLVGHCEFNIVGSKLPSKRDALQVLYYNIREVGLPLRESAKLVIKEILLFWKKARIPTRYERDCVKQLEQLYHQLRNLQKSVKKQSDAVQRNITSFQEGLDDLFDIAHAAAMWIIQIKEDRLFLENQRKRGRPGCMYGIDRKLTEREKLEEERLKKRRLREGGS